MFGIILPGDNLSLASPGQCTQDRMVWSLSELLKGKETAEGGIKAMMIRNTLSYLSI